MCFKKILNSDHKRIFLNWLQKLVWVAYRLRGCSPTLYVLSFKNNTWILKLGTHRAGEQPPGTLFFAVYLKVILVA